MVRSGSGVAGQLGADVTAPPDDLIPKQYSVYAYLEQQDQIKQSEESKPPSLWRLIPSFEVVLVVLAAIIAGILHKVFS